MRRLAGVVAAVLLAVAGAGVGVDERHRGDGDDDIHNPAPGHRGPNHRSHAAPDDGTPDDVADTQDPVERVRTGIKSTEEFTTPGEDWD